MKYRKLFGEVLLASLFLQLFGLITPLFFQVVMDKVLVHKGFSTLTVIGVAYLATVVFENLRVLCHTLQQGVCSMSLFSVNAAARAS